MLSKNIVLLTA